MHHNYISAHVLLLHTALLRRLGSCVGSVPAAAALQALGQLQHQPPAPRPSLRQQQRAAATFSAVALQHRCPGLSAATAAAAAQHSFQPPPACTGWPCRQQSFFSTATAAAASTRYKQVRAF